VIFVEARRLNSGRGRVDRWRAWPWSRRCCSAAWKERERIRCGWIYPLPPLSCWCANPLSSHGFQREGGASGGKSGDGGGLVYLFGNRM